jgi:hypothetical protein
LASVAKIEADTDAEIAAVLAELDAKNPKAADALRAAIAEIESDQLISLPKSEAAPKPVKPVGRPRKCIASENHTGQNTSKP